MPALQAIKVNLGDISVHKAQAALEVGEALGAELGNKAQILLKAPAHELGVGQAAVGGIPAEVKVDIGPAAVARDVWLAGGAHYRPPVVFCLGHLLELSVKYIPVPIEA